MQVPSESTNSLETKVYSFSVGSFFTQGEKVLPENSVLFDFPIHSGEPEKQVGVCYYFGTFSDGNDFVSNLWTPLLDNRANLKDKASFYWQRLRRRPPQRHEIWCPDALSFQSGTSNSPPKLKD